jgi:hypothetical protein
MKCKNQEKSQPMTPVPIPQRVVPSALSQTTTRVPSPWTAAIVSLYTCSKIFLCFMQCTSVVHHCLVQAHLPVMLMICSFRFANWWRTSLRTALDKRETSGSYRNSMSCSTFLLCCSSFIMPRTLMPGPVSEITLSRLDTQWGFTDSTPVEGRCVFACTWILIKELCTSWSQHLNHSHGASIQTLDTIQLRCCLQLRRALWNSHCCKHNTCLISL